MTVVQRTSGDMRLNPHLHVVFLDGAYHEDGTDLVWNELGHLRTGEVGQVLEHAVGRMLRYLRRHGHLESEHAVRTMPRRGRRCCVACCDPRSQRSASSRSRTAWCGCRGGAPSLTGLSRPDVVGQERPARLSVPAMLSEIPKIKMVVERVRASLGQI
ncbi:transposase [Sorangium sp. So ce269]